MLVRRVDILKSRHLRARVVQAQASQNFLGASRASGNLSWRAWSACTSTRALWLGLIDSDRAILLLLARRVGILGGQVRAVDFGPVHDTRCHGDRSVGSMEGRVDRLQTWRLRSVLAIKVIMVGTWLVVGHGGGRHVTGGDCPEVQRGVDCRVLAKASRRRAWSSRGDSKPAHGQQSGKLTMISIPTSR